MCGKLEKARADPGNLSNFWSPNLKKKLWVEFWIQNYSKHLRFQSFGSGPPPLPPLNPLVQLLLESQAKNRVDGFQMQQS